MLSKGGLVLLEFRVLVGDVEDFEVVLGKSVAKKNNVLEGSTDGTFRAAAEDGDFHDIKAS